MNQTLTVPRLGTLALPRLRPSWVVVFLGGINLILIQWVLARELTALLLGTELIVLLVSVSYFAGLSLGYALGGRVNRRWLPLAGVLLLILHLTLPIWFRLLVAWLAEREAYELAFIGLPLLTPFVVSSFYSLFLPLYADHGDDALPTLYGLEVLGSACGVLALVALGGIGLQAVYTVYGLALLLMLLALGMRPARVLLLLIAVVAWLILLPNVSGWSNARWYETLQGLPPGTTTLYTAYSPYQKVDVLETPDGQRYLYLDGLSHFGSPDGERLNVVMGQIPAQLIQPETALVFGAGSMQMEALIADHAGDVLTVELDPLVVEASQRYLLPFNRMDTLTNRRVILDDAKHFIANSRESYDLIATDLPAAYSMQTATLYSAPFFEQVAQRLSPNGVFSVNLTSVFGRDDWVSRRITAGLLQQFDEVMVVTPQSVGWSFAYAGSPLPFSRAQVEDALRQSGEAQFVIYETPAVRVFVGDAPPITLDSLDIALHVSLDWVRGRLE